MKSIFLRDIVRSYTSIIPFWFRRHKIIKNQLLHPRQKKKKSENTKNSQQQQKNAECLKNENSSSLA